MGRYLRVAKLETTTDICNELRRIYRQTRRSELDLKEARTLVWILKVLTETLRDSAVEERITALETRVQEEGVWAARH